MTLYMDQQATSLTHLVHDDDIVHGQEGVARHLSQQEALGEEERAGMLRLGPLVADLIRNGRPVRVERLCNVKGVSVSVV